MNRFDRLDATFCLHVLARRRRLVAAIVGATAILAVASVLLVSPRYTASFTLLAPEGPSVGLLASIRRGLYDRGVRGWVIPAIVDDDRFRLDLARRRIAPRPGVTTTLAEAWGARDEAAAQRAARRFVRATTDAANGVIRVDVTAPDPRVAAAGAREALARLQAELDRWRENLRASRARYHAARLAEARARADSLEADLRAFLSINRGWTESDHADLVAELDRFERRRRVIARVYRELRKRAELDDIEVVSRVPPLEVLDTPVVPALRSWPPRRALVMGAVLGAALVAVGAAFGVEALRSHDAPAPRGGRVGGLGEHAA